MAEKRFFWMKMKPDFFQSKEIKKLRKLAGGDTFTIIYLKMLLHSIATGGKLYFESVEDTFADEIALDIDEDAENVKLTIGFLLSHGLIDQLSEDEILLPEAVKNTGSEGSSASRVRALRERKALQCNGDVTKCNIEIEKEIEKEIECISTAAEQQDCSTTQKKTDKRKPFGEYSHVKLTDEQYARLCEDFGEHRVSEYIEKIDNWMQMYGKKPYKDFNLAIRQWMAKDGIHPKKKEGELEGVI